MPALILVAVNPQTWIDAGIIASKHADASNFDDLRQECAIAGWKAEQKWNLELCTKKMRVFVWYRMLWAVPEFYRTKRYQRQTFAQEVNFDPIADERALEAFAAIEREIDSREFFEWLKETIPPDDYRLIERVYLFGESQASIGREEGTAESTVSHRLRKARERLEEAVRARNGEAGR